MRKYKLTGKFYHRKTFLGLILYVEVFVQPFKLPPDEAGVKYRKSEYKKATEEDASELIRLFQMLISETSDKIDQK